MWIKFESYLLLLMAVVVSVGVFSSSNASASVICAAATIMKVGPVTTDTGKVVVSLRNDSGGTVGTWLPGTQRQYFMSDNIKNQGLAVVLTAMSLDKKIWVQIVDDNATNNSLIQIVYLNR